MLRNGIPYDIAINLSEDELLAYCIVFGQFEGGKWDWSRLEFEKHT